MEDAITAKRTLDLIVRHFEKNGFPFVHDFSILPNPEDRSTLFMCSGMQRYQQRFRNPDGNGLSSLQSCIRTNDIDIVGDGTHLTYFQMLGNFSFNGVPYEASVDMWHEIVLNLQLPVTSVHIHPESEHRTLWQSLGYEVVEDMECKWSDGDIGGYCSELYVGDLEIGNLVNTLGHSTDVGFGFERIIQVMENKTRVDETSLFRQNLPYVERDHVRALEVFWNNGISPDNKGRGYVCRKLLRRILKSDIGGVVFQDWVDEENILREKRILLGMKLLGKHGDKPEKWWWDSLGIAPDEKKECEYRKGIGT